jgi:alpha-glucosidase
VFGGPAWTRVDPAGENGGQWYLHLFAPEQPDLNWSHPDVLDDLRRTLRFWRDRGVDGFRIDVAHGLAKAAGLPDMHGDAVILEVTPDDPRFDQPGVHRIWREVRRTLDEIGAMAVGEVWVASQQSLARYVRDDELHLAFDFRLLLAHWDPAELRAAVVGGLAVDRRTWAVENHDRDRLTARYGGGPTGLARARAMALLLLALPGSVYLYQGQELGLPQVEIAPECRQDPIWERSGHRQMGRDGCRVPLPWTGTAAPYGFSTPGAAAPWLPMPAGWGGLTVQTQAEQTDSTMALHRAALSARQKRLIGQEFCWLPAPDGVLAFRRGEVVCVLNAGSAPVRLDHRSLGLRGRVDVLAGLASHAVGGTAIDATTLPPDAAMWLVGDGQEAS